MKNSNVKKLTVTAMICALSIVAMFVFRFNVMFLTFDFKDAVMAIAALIYGPLTGIACVAATTIIESLSVGDTGIYGLIMDFISSSTFVVLCGLIYKYKRSFSGAIIAAICTVIAVPAVMVAANLIITPLYLENTTIHDVVKMIIPLLLPFNVSKALMNSALMLIIYKPLSTILKKTGLIKSSDSDKKFVFTVKTIVLVVVSCIILILTSLFIIFYLNGEITVFQN